MYSEEQVIEEFAPFTEYFNLCVQNKADWVRLQLLEKYGGVWLDATVFLHKPLSSWIDFESEKLHVFKPPSLWWVECDPCLENWALACQQKHAFVVKWNELYSSFIRMGYQKFKDDMHKVNRYPKFSLNSSYFGMHLCSAILLNDQVYPYENMQVYESNYNVFESTFVNCLRPFLFKTPSHRLLTKIPGILRNISYILENIGCVSPFSEHGRIMDLNHNRFIRNIIILQMFCVCKKKWQRLWKMRLLTSA